MPLKQSVRAKSVSDFPPKLILLGEDDIDDEEMLKEVFASIDDSFSLRFVNNGRKVVSTLHSIEHDHERPCLIVLDYNLPELNAAEILQEIKTLKWLDPIPKIIWSTSGSETYKRLCLELGACDYLTKPASVNSLTDTARYILSFCTVK